jgi:hypothetical protein
MEGLVIRAADPAAMEFLETAKIKEGRDETFVTIVTLGSEITFVAHIKEIFFAMASYNDWFKRFGEIQIGIFHINGVDQFYKVLIKGDKTFLWYLQYDGKNLNLKNYMDHINELQYFFDSKTFLCPGKPPKIVIRHGVTFPF